MGLSMRVKREVGVEVSKRYLKASKKEKSRILDEFVSLTGYNRSYAGCVLRGCCSKKTLKQGKGKTKVIRKRKAKKYGKDVVSVLRSLWITSDYICGKRLAPLLKDLVSALERFGELTLSKETREKLLSISPATIDRLLEPDRRSMELKKGRGGTKPGTLLKSQISIRTFSEWNDKRPGFVEIDLVGHDGGNGRGEFIQTLDVVDIATGWNETIAVKNKAQIWVFEAIETVEKLLPFKLLGIDSDNGSEFINAHFVEYCKKKRITFTRARPYKKNDNCYVEQKNYSIVRRAVGYARYDTPEALETLNELYSHLRLYTNFFQPVMKLKEKTREGSKIKKKYDVAATPYKRIIESKEISATMKSKLNRIYVKLNPAQLKRTITSLQEKLLHISTEARMDKPVDLEYINK